MNPKIASRDEWLAARKDLLAREKELTRLRDEVSAARRKLPWVRVEKEYRFDGPDGPETLADLFGDCSQLIVYHFMYHPDWEEGCKSCSYLADHYDRSGIHLRHRDVSFVTVSRAPLATLLAFRQRMGWSFKWVSSGGTDFNFDYGVSFTPEQLEGDGAPYNYGSTRFTAGQEAPGLSVFAKDDAGDVFHTYSRYSRGLDTLITAYHLLDFVPKGRDEGDLSYGMAWLRLRDRYDGG